MDSHTLKVLEYEKIKSLLGRYLLTEIGRERLAWWGEEPSVNRIRIRAAEKSDLGQVVRRHHAGVGRVKLVAESVLVEPAPDLIDAVSHHERRTVDSLDDEEHFSLYSQKAKVNSFSF